MLISEYIKKYVDSWHLSNFWKHLFKWDSDSTGDSFCDIDILHTMLKYAVESN